MAKKHVKTEVKPVLTKRQLSRHKRQQRIQHIIYITGAAFLVLLIAFLGYGTWNEQIKPYHQPAVEINGVTYDMDYYVKLLSLYSTGKDATETANTADSLINLLHYNQAAMKAAPELGIDVSDKDVNDALKNSGVANNDVNRDAFKATLLINNLIQNYFDKQVPTSVEQVYTQAMLVESADVAEKVRGRLAAGDNFTALAGFYSQDDLTKGVSGDVGWLPKGFADLMLGSAANSPLKDIPFTLQTGEVSQPIFDGTATKSIGYWVVQVTEQDPDKGNHVRGILASSYHDAEVIKEKILAGDDFATLVKTYSQDATSAANNGDIGWTGNNSISNRVVLALAMPLPVGDVSKPGSDTSVKTVGGFWLIKAVARDDNRILDDSTRTMIRTSLFEKWIDEKMKNDTVTTLLTDEQKAWAINVVVKSRG